MAMTGPTVDALLARGYSFEVDDFGRVRVHAPPGHDLGVTLADWVTHHRGELVRRFGLPPVPLAHGGPGASGWARIGPGRAWRCSPGVGAIGPCFGARAGRNWASDAVRAGDGGQLGPLVLGPRADMGCSGTPGPGQLSERRGLDRETA